MSGVKVGGSWRTPGTAYVKVAGVWRIAATVYEKVGGEWKVTTLGSPPEAPVLARHSTAKFSITNFDSSLAYKGLHLSGGTGITFGNDGVITLASANSRYAITVGYSHSAPQSAQAYCERKAYTYHTENHQTCSNNCGVVNGTNCFQGTGTCWCGSCAADGTICCGGCYGQTCSGDPNAQVKDPTPAGYTDSGGEWWRIT